MVRPTWQSADGSVSLFCADSRELLPLLEADCIVTDPPYGIGHPCNYRSRGRSKMLECNDYPDVIGDDIPFDPQPILDVGVPTVLWGANHYADRLPRSSGWLVWDKMRPEELDQSTCELAWTNCVSGVRIFRHLWDGYRRSSEKSDNGKVVRLVHPTQKPIALMEWIMRLPWLEGYQTVFDPYMGSSPVGVAAVRLGKKYVGVELNPDYFDLAVARIEKELKRVGGGFGLLKPKRPAPRPGLLGSKKSQVNGRSGQQ